MLGGEGRVRGEGGEGLGDRVGVRWLLRWGEERRKDI